MSIENYGCLNPMISVRYLNVNEVLKNKRRDNMILTVTEQFFYRGGNVNPGKNISLPVGFSAT